MLQPKQTSCLVRGDEDTAKSHKALGAPNAEVICGCDCGHRSAVPGAGVQRNMLVTPQSGGCFTGSAVTARAGVAAHKSRVHCGSPRWHLNNLKRTLTIAVMLIFFAWCDVASAALRNINLFVEPPAVRFNQSVTLRCYYQLEGTTLYSVKFYRGQLEFFRYTPGEYPNTKVFHFPGIKVDEGASNATQVVLRNVGFALSGNFSCEVTADAPLFSTATAFAQMQVVEFPEKRPTLFTEHTRYEPGDTLRANCSTPPSRPRAELRFTINNIPVSSGETQYIRTVDNLIASRLSLKLQLQGVHLANGANSHMINALGGGGLGSGIGVPYNTLTTHGAPAVGGGGLLLRCTAQIGDLYQEYKEIELGTPQRDPVPARVTLSSGSGFKNFFETYFYRSDARPAKAWHPKQLLIISVLVAALGSFHRIHFISWR